MQNAPSPAAEPATTSSTVEDSTTAADVNGVSSSAAAATSASLGADGLPPSVSVTVAAGGPQPGSPLLSTTAALLVNGVVDDPCRDEAAADRTAPLPSLLLTKDSAAAASVSFTPESSSMAHSQTTNTTTTMTNTAAPTVRRSGGQTSFALLSPLRFPTPAPTTSSTRRSTSRSHGGGLDHVAGRRSSRQRLSLAARATAAAAAAAAAAASPATATRRDHFSGGGGISYENFFFHSEDAASFGIGTVGLYAARAKPVAGAGSAPPITASAMHQHHHHHRRHGQRGAPHPPSAPPSCGGSPPSTSGAGGAGACYYTPACYTSPAVDGVTAWEQRQAGYQQWRRDNLAGTTYQRLSRPSGAPGEVAGEATGTAAAAAEGPNGVPSLCDLVFPSALYTAEERHRIEHRRLRAIQAERAARSSSRVQEQKAYDNAVLDQRTRKLQGEAVDLPDSYLRATYPDSSTLTGYAELLTSGGGGKSSTFPGPHRSAAASRYLANPLRVVKDHHRAVTQHRTAMQQARLDREAQHLEAAERQRHDISVQLADCQARESTHMATWMEGRLHVSRAREKERHERQEMMHRAVDRLNRSAQTHERAVYAMYATQEAATKSAHQQELRTRVIAARPGSRNGAPTSQRLGAAPPPSRPPSAAAAPTSAAGQDAQHAAPPPPPLPTVPRQAAEAVRPITPAVPPSQVVGPTSTSFFNELKQWTYAFPSPNTIPVNGADAAHRRAWKAELNEAQLQFNREATQRQRDDIPRRVQEARDKAFEGNWQQAQHERHEKRDLATRRADHTHADVEAATAVRVGVQEEVQRAQQQRQVQAAERFNETQFLRQQSRQREMLLRTYEAEELQQLRTAVSSASAATTRV
ncbi:hypothetical protein NESM_000854800 [Novymonas esmeraldas]|uniref:200 kDa antigen p200 n=1 Tax=Novymonas esmeraldas TaxID=1808958 RepID=A0AAW0EY19_9TRYP